MDTVNTNIFKVLFDTAPLGMVLLNERCEVVSANMAMGRLVNKDPAALIGSRCGDLLNCRNRNCSPQGCGFSDECASCSIMQAIKGAIAEATAGCSDEAAIQVDGDGLSAMVVNYCIQPVSIDGRRHVVLTLDNITERKQMEAILRHSEERYRRQFMQNQAIMLLIDPLTGAIEDANPAACTFYGYPHDRLLQMNITDINLLPASEVMRLMDEVSQGKTAALYFEHRLAGGDVRNVEVFSSPVTVGGRTVLHSIIIDITEKKRAETALHQQKEFYEKLLQNLSAPTFVLDDQHRVIAWNKACELLTGLAAEKVIGTTGQWRGFYDHERPCLADIVLDGKEELLPTLYRQIKTSQLLPGLVQAEGWYKLRNEDRYIFFNAAPIRSANGEIIAVVETIEDITERKRFEDELRTLSYAITQSPVSIMITSPQGLIEHVNPKFTEVTGYVESEIVGQTPAVLKSGQTSVETYRNLWDTILNGREWRGEFLNKKKNGELYWEEAMISPIKGPDGEITHFIGIKEDITEKKRLEGQLRHAQKMEAVGQLSGGVAHDFNNILTAIVGYASILEIKCEQDDQIKRCITEIIRASERGAKLTKNLLTFSRKQAGPLTRIDINELVGRMVKIVGGNLGPAFRIETKIAESPLRVMADSIQIEQAIMNVITNAREALTGAGGVLAIETETCHMTHELINRLGYGQIGDYAVLTVADTGIGMDEETLKRIYEPFFTTKEMGGGSGLGLSITYGIVKRHNGFISCTSEKGQGSRFKIFLPIIAEGAVSGGEPG
jgi:PAS domain S-box-containing protein